MAKQGESFLGLIKIESLKIEDTNIHSFIHLSTVHFLD